MIAIIDYDAGNIKSVEKAVQFLGEEAIITRDRDVIMDSSGVILPGVGSFGDAMGKINEYGLKNVIYGVGKHKAIPANLRYYKTEMIPKTKDDDFYSVGEELEKHIKEMIQLERGISLEDGKYLLILNDEDAEKLDKKDELLKECKAVYISSAVFLNKSQQKLLSGVDVITIPDYYFEEELREVGEL